MNQDSDSRSDFPQSVVDKIAKKAMYICSNPDCLRMTGYGTTEGKARTIAQAAHILAASVGGPRSPSIAVATRLKAERNGIWLCSICHKKIDDDPEFYTETSLRKWKNDHEDVLRKIVGKDLEAALLELRNHKRYHDECREFLSFLESKRVLYEGLDYEFPPRVLESLQLIRERVVQTRAKISPKSPVFEALYRIQCVIDQFLRNIGPDTDLKTLRCDSKDPVWVRFSEELIRLRCGIIVIMKVVAGDAGYRLTWGT